LKQVKDGGIVLSSTKNTSVMKFNSVRSDGETIVPRFKDSNIDGNY